MTKPTRSTAGRRWAGVGVAVLVLFLPAAAMWLTLRNTPNLGGLEMIWEVDVSDPSTGLITVLGTIPQDAASRVRQIDLIFPDLRKRPDALRSIQATSAGQGLTVVSRPGREHIRRIGWTDTGAPVEMRYTIDPTFFPPGSSADVPADARSRVSEDLAVLRTSSVLPRLEPAGLTFRLRFRLPAGWSTVTPWEHEDSVFRLVPRDQAAVDYIGLGPFRPQEVGAGDLSLRIASADSEGGITAAAVVRLVESNLERLGPPPSSGKSLRSVLVVPRGFMRGGAAGRSSIVQAPDPIVLAHEIIHWWNRPDLTRPDAGWFGEGFTEYFGIRAALENGLIAQRNADACLADLEAEMRYLERDGPVSLEAASRNAGEDSRSSRLVYSKGALLAALLEDRLARDDRSLDEMVRRLIAARSDKLDSRALRMVFDDLYGSTLAESLDAYVFSPEPLPVVTHSPSTGTSGCARFLPQ